MKLLIRFGTILLLPIFLIGINSFASECDNVFEVNFPNPEAIQDDLERDSIENKLNEQKLMGRKFFFGFAPDSTKYIQIHELSQIHAFLELVLDSKARDFFKEHDIYRLDLINPEGKVVRIISIEGQMAYDNGRLIQVDQDYNLINYWLEDPTGDASNHMHLEDFYSLVFSE